MKKSIKHLQIPWLIAFSISITSCQTLISTSKVTEEGLVLPFIKNSANECYFLDDFMPTPDNMVTGKTGAMSIRYYTYKAASYKDWENKHVILSFYSQDDRCWSLFEEYYVID